MGSDLRGFSSPSGKREGERVMGCFLDDEAPIDWNDFEVAGVRAAGILHRLAGDRPLLASLIDDVPKSARLFAMCEHHQLLDRIVLYDGLDRGFRIRVHISTNDSLDRPHDHRFSFASLILRGVYRHVRHVVDEEITGDIEPSRLRQVFVSHERPGKSYTLHHSAIHTTRTTPDTVSLFLRGPAEKPRSFICDRATGRVWWRVGAEDETHERRTKVQHAPDGFNALRRRLKALTVI